MSVTNNVRRMVVETFDPSEVRGLVEGLTVDEKARLTAGADFWRTEGNVELGLDPLKLSDGPNGVRGEQSDERDPSLCTPCGTAMAASWDVELAGRVGGLIGDEASRRAVHVVLGPTVNIHRSPLGGRGFECLSEDPMLSGAVAAGWIEGVQSRGVAATPKHFVANDAETARNTVDNVVDERALREIYLMPFEIATRAGAWALMTAYNKVNGAHCSSNGRLVAGVLKREWGWDGLVISDWFADGDTVMAANVGIDLEMPGPGRLFGEALVDAIRTGAVDEAALDDKLVRLLRLAARVGALRSERQSAPRSPQSEVRRPERAEDLLTEAAAAGFVLLKNERRVLPLDPRKLRRIAVIGPNALHPCLHGGGSASVGLEPVTTPLDAIRARFGPRAEVVYEPGCRLTQLPGLHLLDISSPLDPSSHGLLVERFNSSHDDGPSVRELRQSSDLMWFDEVGAGASPLVRVSGRLTPHEDGPFQFAFRGTGGCRLLIDGTEVGTFSLDSSSVGAIFGQRDTHVEVALRAGQAVLVEVEMRAQPSPFHLVNIGCAPPPPTTEVLTARAVRAAAEADATVLVVGTTADVETEGVDRTTTALPGEQDALTRRILEADPDTVVIVNAGGAVDMEWAESASTVVYAWLPGQAFGPALADVLCGDREPAGRLPITIGHQHEDYPVWETAPDANQVTYRESILVGYRHFDAAGLEPEFCFGHGLGYGDFAYEKLVLSGGDLPESEALTVRVRVRNVSGRRSKEIVQVYVHDREASVVRPPRELKAFAAIDLAPGAAETVSFELGPRAFAYWCERESRWRVEPGAFEIHVGRSSRDIRLVAEVEVKGDWRC